QRDPAVRLKDDVERLLASYRLECAFSVPNAAAPITLRCDLRRRSIEVTMNLLAPADRQRATSRVNWILKQLTRTEPNGIHVRANWPGRTPATQAPLEVLRNDPAMLLAEGVSALPTSFDVSLIRDIAGKFSGRKAFLEEVEAALPYFYEQVGQHLRPYAPRPPKVKPANEEQDDQGSVAEAGGPGGAEVVQPERTEAIVGPACFAGDNGVVGQPMGRTGIGERPTPRGRPLGSSREGAARVLQPLPTRTETC